MARYVLQLGGLGCVRTRTLKALPETAYREIVRWIGLKSFEPIEAECSTRGFRLRPRPRSGASRRPLRASSVVGDLRLPQHRMGLIVAEW